MDIQQNSSNINSNNTQKAQINGLDSTSPVGFRHHLPQIATMARNPKIAQSKASAKTEVTSLEKATVHVEGVGSVLQIREEGMEVELSPPKGKTNGQDAKVEAEKLLESMEMMESETSEQVNELSEPVAKASAGEEKHDETSETDTVNESVGTVTAENKETVDSGEQEEEQNKTDVTLKSDELKSEVETNKNNTANVTEVSVKDTTSSKKSVSPKKSVSEEKAVSPQQKSDSRTRGRSRSAAKSEAAEKTKENTVKADKTEEGTSTGTELSSDELASPVGKRQRKPRKLDIEEEVETPKPKTPKEKVAKPKLEVTPDLEAKHPVTWLVGDLVWSKVSGHPWWPTMISYDPWLGVYTRIGAHKMREYHVQFFGEAAERAWISTNNILEFKGREAFDEHVQKLLEKAVNSKKEKMRIHKWYGIQPSRARAVGLGIVAAEEALPMSRNERKAKYTFVYDPPKKKGKQSVTPTKSPPVETKPDTKTSKAEKRSGKSDSVSSESTRRKRKHEETSTPEPQKLAKRQRTGTPKEIINEDKKTTPIARPVVGTEASFDVFCQKERDTVLGDHPDFTEDQLLDFCRQQWCMMSKKQKARYKSKYSDESELSQQLSPRKRKPSQKMLEAVEDNKAVDEALNKKAASPPAKPVQKPEPVQPKQATPKAVPSKPGTPKATPKAVSVKAGTPKAVSAKAGTTKAVSAKAGTPKTPVPKAGSKKSTPVTAKQKAEDSAKKGKKARNSAMMELQAEVALIKQSAESVEEDEEQPKPEPQAVKLEPAISTPTAAESSSKRERRKKVEVKEQLEVKDDESGSEKQSQSDDGSRGAPSPVPEVTRKPRVEREEEYEMEIYKLSMSGPQKKENLCQICEQTGDLLECQGPCQGFFHMDCLGMNVKPNGEFKCDECSSGVHSCFVCKKSDSGTQKCSVALCGKFYHIDCVKQFPQARVEGKGVTCPLHLCHTCIAGNLKSSAKANHGRLLRCIRCPTAYHIGDFCIAAGSINLTGFNIVCARHFQPILTQKHHTHVNVSWCFDCNKGGTLLCCESCPAAFHSECLNLPEFPTGSWYCSDCVKGKRPLYGEVVWVKIGNYRWWPGEICHPRNVPLNIQEKAHQVGEFPVHFLGSHDYFWLHQGRVFSYQDGDRGSTASMSSKGLQTQFRKGVLEASETYKVWKKFKDDKEQLELEKCKKKPAPFKLVKNNIPLGSVTILKADLSEIPRCDCKAEQENPCGSGSDCLNRLMMYECHPAICPTGEKCQNQRFQKRTYPQQQPYSTEGRGWGLQALEEIKKGEFVNEYVGDLIDEEECKKRIEKAHEDDVRNFYMMTLDMNRIIDAGPKGNLSRFMNHSCGPNLETQKWHVNGDVRVGLFALRDIKAGEELTFNYNLDCLGNEKTQCRCGAQNCSGFLGVRPKTQGAILLEKNQKDSKLNKLKAKKKKKLAVKRKHDDDCFRCGEGGELVMCDKTSCTKSYHLNCLGLDKPPHGKWVCPWHHCDECGKPAVQLCVECPNSFCNAHQAGNTKIFEDKIYCLEHNELLDALAESQSQNSTSDEVSDANSDSETKSNASKESSKVAVPKIARQNSKTENKEKDNRIKDQGSLPPKKRGPKPSLDKPEKQGTSEGTSIPTVPTKRGRPKKSVENGANGGGKGGKGSDLLAVAPMFDDDEDEEFGLVIDIPNF